MRKPEVLDSILNAVARVLAREGFANTTIDAIAAEAGLSKGGVLYYFPTKRDLLLGLIERYETEFNRRRAEIARRLPDTPTRLFKATVTLMLRDLEETRNQIPSLATVLDDEELRKKVGEMKRRTFAEVGAGAPRAGDVALILYAVDGLWLDNRFDPNTVSRPVRDEAIKRLLQMVDSLDA